MNEFDPMQKDRPPRSEGYKEETKEICGHIKDRGDQRIGQLLLNAIAEDNGSTEPGKVVNRLWNIEAWELLELLENLEEKTKTEA